MNDKQPPKQARARGVVRQIEVEILPLNRNRQPSQFVPREVAEEAYIRGGLDAIRLHSHWYTGIECIGFDNTPLVKAVRDWIGTNPRTPTTTEDSNG